MRNFRLLVLVTIWMSMVWGLSKPVFAQDAASPEPTLKEQVEALDQKIRILERRAELEKESATAKAKEVSILNAGKDGLFTLKSADNNFKLRVGGYLQVDGRFFLHDETAPLVNTFLLRRVRPILEGTVYKYYDFRIMPDFGGGTASLQDAYLSISYWPQAKLQVGKFKPPVGLERLQSGANLLFVERTLPTNLVPNRDIGLQLYGDLGDGAFSYALGVFNGVADLASADIEPSSNDDKDVVGRIFGLPFKTSDIESLQGLGLGIAGSYGNEQGTTTAPNLPSYRTPAQQTFFTYIRAAAAPGPTFADGQLIRYSPQAYYYWGPFGLLGEYVRSSQEVKRGTNSAKLTHSAEQLAVSYVLTGGTASYKGVKPKHQFDPRNGEWGEFELKARYSRLVVDDDAFPTYADPVTAAREAKAWAVGVNWYLNKNIKLNLDYETTAFKGGGGTASTDREDEKVILNRFQIVF
ncbi:MAG: hypothetical protein L0Y56_18485 [Nitrospira sp.]|nr:hypothetical protein [Nitrospira sp.]